MMFKCIMQIANAKITNAFIDSSPVVHITVCVAGTQKLKTFITNAKTDWTGCFIFELESKPRIKINSIIVI